MRLKRRALVVLLALLAGESSRAAYPVTLQDDRGHAIAIPARPRRIVIAGPALFAQILARIGAADRVVGIAESPEIPDPFAALPRVGQVAAVSVERVVGLTPDLVIGSFGAPRDALEAAGLRVLTTVPTVDFAGVLRTIEELGLAVDGEKTGATRLVTQLRGTVDEIASRVPASPRPRVALLYPFAGSPPLTSGSGTPEHELLSKAGAENAFGDVADYHRVSYEEILGRDPDALIVDASQLDWIRSNEVIASLRAVREGRVLAIAPSAWVSTGVPETLRTVAKWLHPEAFPEAPPPASPSSQTAVP